jgi:hypothetical protein
MRNSLIQAYFDPAKYFGQERNNESERSPHRFGV